MLALDPNETSELTLALDLNKVIKPTFIIRFMSCRESFAFAAKLRAAKDEPDDEKAFAILQQALCIAVVGWRNIDPVFSPEAFADVMTPTEAWELALRIPDHIVMNEVEKKKSFLQSQLDTAKDASTTAAPENA